MDKVSFAVMDCSVNGADAELSSIIKSQHGSEEKTESQPNKHFKEGLSLPLASVFIVGEMAGSGVLALPQAIAESGWGGLVLLIVCCVNCLYAGICLGRCWMILEERYDEYKEKNRYPYPTIAYRAVGVKMRYVVSACNDFTLFGVATVFLLLASQMIGSLAEKWGISFCFWIFILAAVLCPLMWLGTPDDFWPAAIVALVTTVLACILIVAGIAKDASASHKAVHSPPTVTKFFLAFGTILFAFGGAATFPTFQNDMKDRTQFTKAASIGFGVLLLLYVPVSVMGYSVYGDSLDSNVLQAMPDSAIKTTVEVLLALHLVFAFLLVINAPAQEFEEFLKLPKGFGWKRVALRSSMMVVVLFVAQTVPRFGKVLDLVGGSTTTLTSSIFPCWFYLSLCSQERPEWPKRYIPTYEKVYLIGIMVIGVVGGCMATYSAIGEIVKPDSFSPPCYVNITAAGMLG